MAPWVTMPVDGAGEDGRAPPPLCPHFGTCGGCAAQDLGDAAYRRWKRGFVEAALRRAGVEAEVAAPVSVPPAARRRARFFAARSASGLSLGFHARASHDVVDMTTSVSPRSNQTSWQGRQLSMENDSPSLVTVLSRMGFAHPGQGRPWARSWDATQSC